MPKSRILLASCLFFIGCSRSLPNESATPLSAGDDAEAEAAAARLPYRVSNKIKVIVEPTDDGQALIDAINAATQSVHVTMYLMTDTAVEDAIIGRAQAGLDVKVILNRHSPGGGTTPLNVGAWNKFQAAGVSVVAAPEAFVFTHEKCVIIDQAQAWIMTMNTSFSAPRKNREFLAIDTDPRDIAEAEAIFQADFAGEDIAPSGALIVSPNNARERLVALLVSARHTLDLEQEEFASRDIADTLCQAQANGIETRVLLAADDTPGVSQTAMVAELQSCGVTVVSLATPIIHAKAIIADGKRAYIGSINISDTSMDKNRELGLVTTNKTAVKIIADTVAADIAAGTPVVLPPACQTAEDCPNATDACYAGFCHATCIGNECKSGYVCVSTVVTTPGTCKDQSTLTCSATTDCGAGLVCNNGLCGYCTSDTECAEGTVCQPNGWCKAPPPPPPAQ